jgi:hypothetical protein
MYCSRAIDVTLLTEAERMDFFIDRRPVNDRGVQGPTVAQFVRMTELKAKAREQIVRGVFWTTTSRDHRGVNVVAPSFDCASAIMQS